MQLMIFASTASGRHRLRVYKTEILLFIRVSTDVSKLVYRLYIGLFR